MNFLKLAEKRYSCRKYTGQAVEREKINKCIEAARFSPSASNSQPWSFIIVDSPELTGEVASALQTKGLAINRFTRNCGAFIVIIEEKARILTRLGGMVNNQKYAQIDIGIAAQNIALCAADMGLGNCIIGWFNNRKLRRVLKFPSNRRVRLVVSLGYPADNSVRKKIRKPLDEIVHYNEW